MAAAEQEHQRAAGAWHAEWEPFADLLRLTGSAACWGAELLTALRQEEELALHLRGALRNGLSHDQISEVLLHAAVYAGVPAANRAFAIAQRVLAEDQ